MIFKQQSPQNTQSVRLKYQSDSLRKQFLSQLIVQPSSSNTSQSQSQQNRNISKLMTNQSRGSNKVQQKKKNYNADSSSEQRDREEMDSCGSHGSEDGVNSDQNSENSGNLKSNISNSASDDQFMYNKETCIVRNSKNWKDLKISLDSQQQQQNPNPIPFLLKNQQSNTKIFPKSPKSPSVIPDQPTVSKKSLAACSSATPHSTIELTNYRTMLKNQIKKSRNLQQQLSKQNHRNNLLMELVKKLKQENQVLRKVVKKSVNGNQGTNFKKKSDKTIKTVKNRERNIQKY